MKKLVLICAITLTGCASKEAVWEQAGASDKQFGMDRGQCMAQTESTVFASVPQKMRIYTACMNGKGWQLVEK